MHTRSCHYLSSNELIYRKGVGINEKDEDGNTALHHAVLSRKLKAAEWLIEHKAKIDKTNKEKKTGFDLAVETDYRDMIQLLDRTRIKKAHDKSLKAGMVVAVL